ncbi:MAG: hypothetical protein QGH66_00215 [Dehalococcoidia bacterium]|jgi:hypothetical protein|nr:hypothetical protein [Dehalococcoidia bacterium]MDP7240574.1 hypothetical protein [Dehalococcoidia bacterium]
MNNLAHLSTGNTPPNTVVASDIGPPQGASQEGAVRTFCIGVGRGGHGT